jgi:hypothetical protein
MSLSFSWDLDPIYTQLLLAHPVGCFYFPLFTKLFQCLRTDMTFDGAKILSNFASSLRNNFSPSDPSVAECTASERAASAHLPKIAMELNLEFNRQGVPGIWFFCGAREIFLLKVFYVCLIADIDSQYCSQHWARLELR